MKRRARLTDCFLDSLAQATTDERSSYCLTRRKDDGRHVPLGVGRLLQAVEDGLLPNVRWVLSGRNAPEVDGTCAWSSRNAAAPAAMHDIVEYLSRVACPKRAV
jgi:hypothetical protein